MPYIGRSTDGFGVRNRFLYLASASDTSVSGADANGATLTFTDGAYVDVYLNGVLLKAGTDYNTNTANTIAGISSMAANDEVTVIVYDVFTVGDMVSATSGGTFVGNVAMSGTLGVTGATTTAAITASGVVDITDTTDASDATGDTGALRTEGGASIAKKLYVGTDLDVDGTANLDVVDIDGAVDMASTLSVTGTTKLGEIASIGQATPLSPNDATSFLHIGDNNNQDTSIILEDAVEIWEIYQNDTLSFRKDTTIVQELHRDGYVTQPLQPAFHATSTGSGFGHDSIMVFNTAHVNTGSNYNTSNGKFTAPVAGVYFFYHKNIGTSSSTVIRVKVYYNDSIFTAYKTPSTRQDTSTGNDYAEGVINFVVSLSVGDTIKLGTFADDSSSGIYNDNSGGQGFNYFGGYLIG